MGRITVDLIIKQGSHIKRRSNESTSQFLRRLTHLYFQEKGIEEIENLSECRNLSVLYLYDNEIRDITNLGFAYNLTHLYLQKNNITRTTGLEKLERLTKLYLGYNQISVIEGLENLTQLAELHVEYQNLPAGEQLLFDPRSLEALSKSVEVLNIAGNNLDEVSDFRCLRHMSHFIASDNNINDFMDVAKCLGSWFNLTSLDMAGNPLCHRKKYRDKIILMSKPLASLDGKEISGSTRNFLQNWYASKQARRVQRKQQELDGSDDNDSLRIDKSNLPSLRHYSVSGRAPVDSAGKYMANAWPRKSSKPGQVLSGRTDNTANLAHELGKYQARLPDIRPMGRHEMPEKVLVDHFAEMSLATKPTLLHPVGT